MTSLSRSLKSNRLDHR